MSRALFVKALYTGALLWGAWGAAICLRGMATLDNPRVQARCWWWLQRWLIVSTAGFFLFYLLGIWVA